MANLSEIFLKQETLETLLKTVQAKGLKGVSLTISMNDEANEWGQTFSPTFLRQKKTEKLRNLSIGQDQEKYFGQMVKHHRW